MTDSVAIFSGGLDSTTLVYNMLDDGRTPHLVSFDYGQRHKKELEYAARTAQKLSLKHSIVDLSGLTKLLAGSGSSLVSGTEVPDGHYAEDSMKATVVPNRNMIMLSIAGGIAVAEGADSVHTGVHAGDHFIYPDCRTGFVGAAALALYLGNEGLSGLWRAPIVAPFIHKSKADISRRALDLDVPFAETWSCYKGGELHCGRCGTCVERLEAINEALVGKNAAEGLTGLEAYRDFTIYEDDLYWKSVTKND